MATLNIKNLPDPLYAALKERADEQHRSVAQEVTHILTEALRGQEPLSILALQGLGRELWVELDAARHVEDERASWD
jgi:plasmid stability protein